MLLTGSYFGNVSSDSIIEKLGQDSYAISEACDSILESELDYDFYSFSLLEDGEEEKGFWNKAKSILISIYNSIVNAFKKVVNWVKNLWSKDGGTPEKALEKNEEKIEEKVVEAAKEPEKTQELAKKYSRDYTKLVRNIDFFRNFEKSNIISELVKIITKVETHTLFGECESAIEKIKELQKFKAELDKMDDSKNSGSMESEYIIKFTKAIDMYKDNPEINGKRHFPKILREVIRNTRPALNSAKTSVENLTRISEKMIKSADDLTKTYNQNQSAAYKVFKEKARIYILISQICSEYASMINKRIVECNKGLKYITK